MKKRKAKMGLKVAFSECTDFKLRNANYIKNGMHPRSSAYDIEILGMPYNHIGAWQHGGRS